MGCAIVRNTNPSNYPARTSPTARIPLPHFAGMAFDDPEIAMRIDAEGPVDVMTLMADLGGLIPLEYLRGSIAQRRALLAGLLDARATVDEDGWIIVPAATRHMTAVVADPLQDWATTTNARPPAGSASTPTTMCSRCTTRRSATRNCAAEPESDGWSVRPVPSVPVRCVQVDNDAAMYLAGEAMVPTHNSTLAMDFLRSASIGHHLTAAMFSLEMSKIEIVMRLLSAEAKIKLADMRSGSMSDDDWSRLARRMGEISEAPVHRRLTQPDDDGDPRQGPPPLKQRHDLKLVVVDYMQLMTSGKKVESRQQEVSRVLLLLKLLAKEPRGPRRRHLPAQPWPLNNAPTNAPRSLTSRIGQPEQDADMVILLHRPDSIERDDPCAGEADIIVGKHRNGPTATITVAHQLHLSRFVDMARGQQRL